MSMDMLDLLASDNYIVVNKDVIKCLGLECAVILGELCSEYRYWKNQDKLVDGMFYCTAQNMEDNTGLSAHVQRKALNKLEELGIIDTAMKGLPAKKHFRINTDKLLNSLNPSCVNFKELGVKDFSTNNNNINNNKNKTLSKDKVSTDENFLGSLNNLKSNKTKKPTLFEKCKSLVKDFTDDVILQNMLEKCLQMFLTNSRESGMPFYTNHFKGKLNKLKSLSEDNYVQRDIVKQTIDNGWNNFYELKENKSSVHNRLNESGAEKVPTVNKKSRKENIANGKAEKF